MSCVIFGAGKIARGFIGHLLYLSEIPFTFVEKAEGLVDLINERGQYTVNILGNSDKNCIVKNVKAIHFSEVEKIAEAISEATVVFTSVGGKNLGELVPLLAKGIEKKAAKGGGGFVSAIQGMYSGCFNLAASRIFCGKCLNLL